MRKSLLAMIILLAAVIAPGQAQEMPAGILFVGVASETSDIYLWHQSSEGNKVTPLTRTPQKEGNAQWWAQKGLILASRESSPDRYGLIAIDEKLKTVWNLTDPGGSLGWPVPSPWDDRILCVRALDNGFVQTGIVSFPQGAFEPFDFDGLAGGQLAWLAPDRIMLSRVTEQGFMITHRDLNTGKEEVIVSGGQNWQSYVNQATGRMFFVRRHGQTGSIFELFKDAEGRWEYDNLTNARTYDWQPSTSPDGQTLIYRSLREGFFQTILRDLATGNEKTIEIKGFSQIYFPIIVDHEAVERLTAQTLPTAESPEP